MINLQAAADWLNISVDEPALPGLLDLSEDLVGGYLGTQTRCPESVREWAVIEVAGRLWERRNSPNGAVQFGPDGQTIYNVRDILASVSPMLKRFRPLGGVG